MCNHKRDFNPPLSQRKRFDGTPIKASEIPCTQCIEADRQQFYAKLRAQAEAEKLDPSFNPRAPFIKGLILK